MPRQARIDAPGALHHIIARGIERAKIFHDDQDRDFFVTRLGNLIVQTQTKCLAWALIPNHFHLLLKTGTEPIAGFMRRLLTSVAVTHNRRHRRSGRLFQNRYKSILCQEDAYLKALVRYIHLNPLRSGIVKNVDALDRYRFAGHSFIMGKEKNVWQSVNEVLALFGRKKQVAQDAYREFVTAGIELGRQPDLVGGGLIRSAGGWAAVQSLRKAGLSQKSDERILGDGDFVDSVLNNAQECLEKRHRLAAKGIRFEDVFAAVSELLCVHPRNLLGPSKERTIVKARALCCYWAVRELGMSMSNVAARLKIAGPTVSVAVKKGHKIVSDEGLVLSDVLNLRI